MANRFTYGRQERLKSRKLIEQLFREGKSLAIPPFRVYYLLNKKEGVAAAGAPAVVQCGFGVSSRQFKKAVDRNRVKRVSREAWRLQKQALTDVMAARPEQLALFFIYTGKELPDFTLVKEKTAVIINKLIAIMRK